MDCVSTSKKPNSLKNYYELADTIGRCIRDDKADRIDNTHSPILQRLGLDSAQRLRGMTKAKALLKRA